MTRIGIVGCGSIGRRHLANLRQLGHSDVFVYDAVETDRDSAAAEFGVIACADLTELWAQRPELTLVCTPSNLHTAVAIEAARLGSHLFVEKPLAHSLDQLDVLDELVRAKELVTLVGCNMRFHPGPAQVKRWLDEGVIGQVLSARIQTGSYLPGWRPQQDYRQSYSASTEWGGAVLDCIHELDLALWLQGKATLRSAVTRPATSLGLQTDGLAEIILEHTGGAISNVHLNFVQRNYHRTIEIIGSEGSIEWSFNRRGVDLYGPAGTLDRQILQPADWQLNQMYLDEMSYLMRHVEKGAQTFNPVANAIQTLRIALEARRSE